LLTWNCGYAYDAGAPLCRARRSRFRLFSAARNRAFFFEECRTMARIEIKSEITGTVWQVTSKPGDKVESGDTLIVIESMKMEIPVIAEDGGTVKEILVKEKDPVAEGQVVAILED
jgi:acetyl-CoA carboxylase biotin carboxyl carrier protein